jgi:hypothetical protein
MKRILFAMAFLLGLSVAQASCAGNQNKNDKNNSLNNGASGVESRALIPEESCKSILNRLYNDYVFGDRYDEFNQAVSEFFTPKAQQKLIDAYEYDCDGVCYAIWALRTNAQDSKEEGGKSGVEDIWRVIGNVYEVHYSDGGWNGSTRFLFTSENGKVKIDDFLRGYDDSAADFGPWNVDTQDVVVDDQGNIIGTYLFTDGDNYIVMVQDYAEVSVAGHRKVTYSAENGQGVIYTLRSRVNVRESPTTKSPVVAVMPTPGDGMAAETFPCLGKTDEWYKIRINGKEGYVREDLVEWDFLDRF